MNSFKWMLCGLFSLFSLLVSAQNSDAERGLQLYNEGGYKGALICLQRAAKAGNIEVLSYLGDMFLNGKGTEVNYTAAMNMYKRGAEHKNTECMFGLFKLYYNGYGVEQDNSKAFFYAKEAADAGNAMACSVTSVLYEGGIGTEKDLALAVDYADRAVLLGNTGRCEWLGFLYYKGEGVRQSYQKALHLWTFSGVDYSPSVQLLTACMLHDGQGTTSVIQSYPCAYEQRFHDNGVTGKTYLAEALTISDQLVGKGYDEARPYQRKWKNEYDNRVSAANKITAPQFSKEASRYVERYSVPREMAYCGGRAQYGCIIRSNGRVDEIRTLVCPVEAKASFDKAFLAGLPPFVPGTKGGEPVDMYVVFWIDWVPSRNLQMARFELLR